MKPTCNYPPRGPDRFGLVMAGVLALAALSGGFLLLDAALGRTGEECGTIADKSRTDARTATETYQTGKGQTGLRTVRHPAHWWLVVDLDGERLRVDVGEGIYDRAEIGEPVLIRARVGRFTRSRWVTEVISVGHPERAEEESAR